jgi:hypothetical protein
MQAKTEFISARSRYSWEGTALASIASNKRARDQSDRGKGCLANSIGIPSESERVIVALLVQVLSLSP